MGGMIIRIVIAITGTCISTGSVAAGSLDRIEWVRDLPGDRANSSSVLPNGTVIVAVSGGFHESGTVGQVHAFSSEGDHEWMRDLDGYGPTGVQAITPEGSAILPTHMHAVEARLHSISSDGRREWSRMDGLGVMPSVALAAYGHIFAGKYNGPFFALNRAGEVYWRRELVVSSGAAPSVGPQGVIYVGTNDGLLHALNPATGNSRWTLDLTQVPKESPRNGSIKSSPAIDAAGNIYIVSPGGHLCSISADGKLRWTVDLEAFYGTSPAIGPDGTIYVGSRRGGLHAVTSDGVRAWQFAEGEAVHGTPAVGADGTVFVGSGNRLVALSPDGNARWTLELPDTIRSAPALTDHGRLYVTTWKPALYAIDADVSGPAESGWPMFRHDAQRTGRAR